jgi:hypothetical protein
MDEIFKTLNFKNSELKMVFLSACHSESVGKMFKEMSIPIVIAVNQ